MDGTRGQALSRLARDGPAYDAIFLDPPYDGGWVNRTMALIASVRSTASAALTAANEKLATAMEKITSLYAQINAAKARIAALVGGTDPAVLDPIKMAASAAATAANDAYTGAKADADAAGTAALHRATIQTTMYNSVMDAAEADAQAEMAKAEAEKAKTASEMAQAATDTATATPHKEAAEAAQAAAEAAEMKAEEAKDKAEMAAMKELKINGTTKSVGEMSITVDGRSHSSTDGRTHVGLLDGMNIMQKGTRDQNGHLADAAVETGPRAAANVTVGVTYDSEEDDARLTLVHSYLGTQKQKQFIRAEDTASTVTDSPFGDVPTATGLAPNTDSTDAIPNGTIDVPLAAANEALGLTGDAALTSDVRGTPRSAGAIAVAFDALKAAPPVLYFIYSNVKDNSTGADDDGIDQTRIFLERRVIGNAVTYDVVYVREVTVEKAMAYMHIHYGLWNGISGRDGNAVSELGTGFVTALADGEGMTAVGDMPNVGKLTYNGNWVANVQMADLRGNGVIERQDGAATIVADIDKNDVDVTLTGLAMLEGAIDGNMFSGTKMTLLDSDDQTDGVQPGHNLGGASSDFSGTFSGGFFGPRAVEAGGVFDYSSEDNHEGAFRGSFGGKRK